jgi:hypothetical protein
LDWDLYVSFVPLGHQRDLTGKGEPVRDHFFVLSPAPFFLRSPYLLIFASPGIGFARSLPDGPLPKRIPPWTLAVAEMCVADFRPLGESDSLKLARANHSDVVGKQPAQGFIQRSD